MIKLTRCASAILLTVIIICAGCGREPARVHYEKTGGFSYDPPEGWQIMEFPGLKYRISHGPTENEFAPNINIVDETFKGGLTAYVDGSLENMKKLFTDFTVLKREEFQTEDGLSAIRLVAENKQHGRMLRQTSFFFSKARRKYVATCTTLAEEGEGLDGLFAQSMKTFRIH